MKDKKKMAGRKTTFDVNSSCLSVMRDVVLFLHVFLYFKIISWLEHISFIFIINTAIFNYEVWKSEITLFCDRLLGGGWLWNGNRKTRREGVPRGRNSTTRSKGRSFCVNTEHSSLAGKLPMIPRELKQHKMCSVLNQFLSTLPISKFNFPTHTQNKWKDVLFLPPKGNPEWGGVHEVEKEGLASLRDRRKEGETQRRSPRKLEQDKTKWVLNQTRVERWRERTGTRAETSDMPGTAVGGSLQLRAVPSASF